MRPKGKIIIALCFLCIGFCLAGISPAMAARVAGEKGATPITTPLIKEDPAREKSGSPEQGTTGKETIQVIKEVADEKTTPESAQQETDEDYVTIDFDNVDIAIFIKFISELTGKNFVINKAVRGKVTIISPTKISVKEAYKVFESVLEVNGYTTVPAGKITKIIPTVQARSKSIETRLHGQIVDTEDKVVTQLIHLGFADPDKLKKLFAPLISKNSVIISYPPTRMLIVTDVLSNIKRLNQIIKAIDLKGIGEEISVIALEHASAVVIAKSLNTVFQATAKTRTKGSKKIPAIKIVPDERTNVLITLATEDDTQKIRQLIKLLDTETPRGEGGIRVYYLQNADAEDLAKVLTALPSKKTIAGQKGRTPVISKEVQIVADSATNSLVITASKDDYLVLEDVITKLDIPRTMVYIEALIMEVNVNKNFELGVEWQAIGDIGTYKGRQFGALAGSKSGQAIFPSVTTQGLASLASGFSLGVLGEGIKIGGITFPTTGAVLRAFRNDSDVHILSTPQIMTTDNEEAEITVGKNVPYITRQETSQAELDYNTYEYKDVGVTLKITPQINQKRFVRLNIFQEVTRLIKTEGLEKGYPTTYKRLAQTTVIVKDSNTVVIGGLIDDSTSYGEYKVPCLANIPVLGWLFQSMSKEKEKTNLYIFLTPHIIENPAEAGKIYQEKKEQIHRIKEGVIKMYHRDQSSHTESDDK